VCRRPLVTV